MDRFRAISPQLRRLLSKGSYDGLREHMEKLQFNDAAKVLEGCPPQGGIVAGAM